MNYRTVKTSELRTGDVVNCHGMRCLIDGEIEISRSHPDSPGVGDGKTRWTRALVLNRDDVPHEVVPMGFTLPPWGERLVEPVEHRWTIQGNDLAYWSVEEAAS